MTMASSRAAEFTLPTDEQILVTRDFDAPRALAYRAWTRRSSCGNGGAGGAGR